MMEEDRNTEPQAASLAPMAEEGVHAGFPSPAQDYMNSFIDLNKELVRHPAATFFVRVVGDSMGMLATIINGLAWAQVRQAGNVLRHPSPQEYVAAAG